MEESRGPGLTQLLDVVTLLVFIPIQCRVTVLGLRMARQRPLLVRAIVLLNILFAIGWVLDFVPAVDGPLAPGKLAFWWRTLTLAYGMTATVALTFQVLLQALNKVADRAKFSPGRRRALTTVGNVALATPFLALSYGALIGRLDFHVREIDVPAFLGLPADLDGLRVLHLSDIHLSAFLSEAQLAHVIDAANNLRPHFAAITGDLISGPGDPIDACLRQLTRPQNRRRAWFGCMGNHEHFAGVESYTCRRWEPLGPIVFAGPIADLAFRTGHHEYCRCRLSAAVSKGQLSARGREVAPALATSISCSLTILTFSR